MVHLSTVDHINNLPHSPKHFCWCLITTHPHPSLEIIPLINQTRFWVGSIIFQATCNYICPIYWADVWTIMLGRGDGHGREHVFEGFEPSGANQIYQSNHGQMKFLLLEFKHLVCVFFQPLGYILKSSDTYLLREVKEAEFSYTQNETAKLNRCFAHPLFEQILTLHIWFICLLK